MISLAIKHIAFLLIPPNCLHISMCFFPFQVTDIYVSNFRQCFFTNCFGQIDPMSAVQRNTFYHIDLCQSPEREISQYQEVIVYAPRVYRGKLLCKV